MTNHLTAYLVTVVGFRGATGYRPDRWAAVFDAGGILIQASPRETLSAIRIRYCEVAGVPAAWVEVSLPQSPGELAALRENLEGGGRPAVPVREVFPTRDKPPLPIRKTLARYRLRRV